RVAGVAALALVACGRPEPPSWPVTSPRELCRDPSLAGDAHCLPARRIERLLASEGLVITHAAVAAAGDSKPFKARVEVPDGSITVSFNVKIKPVGRGLDSFNNSPRRELAAYQLQKMLLDPDEQVVPPTLLRCLMP